MDSELKLVCDEEFDDWYDEGGSLRIEKNGKVAYLYWQEKRMSPWFDDEEYNFEQPCESFGTVGDKKGLYDTVKGVWIVEPKAESV